MLVLLATKNPFDPSSSGRCERPKLDQIGTRQQQVQPPEPTGRAHHAALIEVASGLTAPQTCSRSDSGTVPRINLGNDSHGSGRVTVSVTRPLLLPYAPHASLA